MSWPDWCEHDCLWNSVTNSCFQTSLFHHVSFQMSPDVFLQDTGRVQHSDVRRRADCPSWAAGDPAVRGADRAEGPHAVLWRSHRGRSGLYSLLAEQQQQQQLSARLPSLPRKQGSGLSQYPADHLKPCTFFNKHLLNLPTDLTTQNVGVEILITEYWVLLIDLLGD